MNTSIDIDQAILKKIKKEVEELYYKKYRHALECEIELLLQPQLKVRGVIERPVGPVRAIIQEQVAAFLLQDKTVERMKGYIEDALIPQLQACIDDTMRHAVRREHFETITQKVVEQNKTQ